MSQQNESLSERAVWHTFLTSIKRVCPTALFDLNARDGKVDDDDRLLTRHLGLGREGQAVRVWNNRRQLVTSRRLSKLQSYERAAAAMSAIGWPVAIRTSGGTTVAHHSGVMNISMLNLSETLPDHGKGFDMLCDIIVRAASALGITLTVDRYKNAYCQGSHDIGWQGRKIAGTSALYRCRSGLHGAVYHASVVVYGDCADDVAAISEFEQRLGLPSDYHPADHTSLFEAYRQQDRHRSQDSVQLLPFL